MNSLFVSPAVTPIKSVTEPYSNNPSFRMYRYDRSDHAVLVRTSPNVCNPKVISQEWVELIG